MEGTLQKIIKHSSDAHVFKLRKTLKSDRMYTEIRSESGQLSQISKELQNSNMVTPVVLHIHTYSETSLFRHSIEPENNVGLGGCWIMESLLPYLRIETVLHIMV